MNRREADVLARLAEANPVQVRELQNASERAWADDLLKRLLDEPVGEPDRSPQKQRRKPPRLALAGALALSVVTAVVALAFLGNERVDPVAEARAALSGRDGVFHVVTQITTSEAGRPATQLWMETWASADGRRSHSLIYGAAPDGGRGGLLGESVGRRDGVASVMYAAPADGAAVPADGQPAAERPLSYVVTLLRSGKVKHRARVKFAGREARRFAIEHRVGRSRVVFPSGSSTTPAYTQRTVLIIDGRSHLPLFLRSTGLVPKVPGRRGASDPPDGEDKPALRALRPASRLGGRSATRAEPTLQPQTLTTCGCPRLLARRLGANAFRPPRGPVKGAAGRR